MTIISKANEVTGNAVVNALKKRGFDAEYVASKDEALKRVLEIIPEKASVGIPGTVTVRDIGALDALKARGNDVRQHWGGLSKDEMKVARFAENDAEYFLTSANALTRDGEIINIDGSGNRVAGMAWGKGPVIFVIGINKLTFDLQDGIKRARSATIPNAIRQNEQTACVKAGKCVHCLDDASMCRAMLILERPLKGRKYHVIIVGENLGY